MKKLKYRDIRIRTKPSIILIVLPSIRLSMKIAAVDMIRNVARIGIRRFQVTYFLYLYIATEEDVSARSPDKVTASPYDGMRKGRAVIMKIPKPKPMVLCMKLAPIASRNIYRYVYT